MANILLKTNQVCKDVYGIILDYLSPPKNKWKEEFNKSLKLIKKLNTRRWECTAIWYQPLFIPCCIICKKIHTNKYMKGRYNKDYILCTHHNWLRSLYAHFNPSKNGFFVTRIWENVGITYGPEIHKIYDKKQEFRQREYLEWKLRAQEQREAEENYIKDTYIISFKNKYGIILDRSQVSMDGTVRYKGEIFRASVML